MNSIIAWDDYRNWPSLMEGARAAVFGIIDHSSKRYNYNMNAVEAFMLCSVCRDLRISKIVNMLNWVVSFYFPRAVLELSLARQIENLDFRLSYTPLRCFHFPQT